MDRERFDALARLLATTGSRRATLGAFLGVGLLGHDPDALAKPGKGRGKDRKRRRKRGRNDRDDDQNPEPSSEACCGATKPCAPPEPGSTRAGCDFGDRSFAGEDHHGSIFRRIEGAGANFDDTDNHGSVFAAACLRFATFRGANLRGTTWDNACLFAADFTGADLGGDAATLAGAVLCATTMPDGTRNDRDCGRSQAHPCCLPPPGGGGGGGPQPCNSDEDCPDRVCQRKLCIPDVEECGYAPVTAGPIPNALCATTCCGGVCCPTVSACCASGGCCPSAAHVCTNEFHNHCCLPNCAGRECGDDGCGGSCGTCAPGVACFRGACSCGVGCVGCCDVGRKICHPGTTTQHCGREPGQLNGFDCKTCQAGQLCIDGRCV